jgi:hypothetical protein
MKKIFIFHSIHDQRFFVFFSRILLTVEIDYTWQTYETFQTASANSPLSEMPDELFFILDKTTDCSTQIPLILSRYPNASVWVFESCEDLKRITSIFPKLTHSVELYITNAWADYVSKIVESFEKTKSAFSVTENPQVRLKSLELPEINRYFDSTTGQCLFDYSTARSTGFKITCPHCQQSYGLHLPTETHITRCRRCGSFNELKLETPAAATVPTSENKP